MQAVACEVFGACTVRAGIPSLRTHGKDFARPPFRDITDQSEHIRLDANARYSCNAHLHHISACLSQAGGVTLKRISETKNLLGGKAAVLITLEVRAN